MYLTMSPYVGVVKQEIMYGTKNWYHVPEPSQKVGMWKHDLLTVPYNHNGRW